MRRACRRVPALAAAVLLASCGGLAHALHPDVPAPTRLAVLPFAGTAPAPTLELARSLCGARLGTMGYHVAEPEFVDRVLTERGWLVDPASFAPAKVDVAALCEELGVDAVLTAEAVDESSFNLVLLRRHVVGARLRIVGSHGVWWDAQDQVGGTAGFLLQSGQVFSELRAQGMHGSSARSVALVDQLVENLCGTVPPAGPDAAWPPPAPSLAAPDVRLVKAAAGERWEVTARAPQGTALAFELEGAVVGVPMAGRDGEFTGAVDVPPGNAGAVVVRARGPFGAEQRAEVRR